MLLWTAGETAPFVTTAAARTPDGAFGPTETVSQTGESTSTDGLSGDGKGNFLALYSRDDGGGEYTLKARLFDGEPPQFVSLSVPQRAKTGKPASFSASVSDTWSAISSVEWSFGDGRSATGASVKHTYRRTGGKRTVKVTATDAAGNSRTEERTIVVKDVTPAVIAGARFRPSKFAASGKSTAGASKARRGSTLRYRLSERARVRVVFERTLKGHRLKMAGLHEAVRQAGCESNQVLRQASRQGATAGALPRRARRHRHRRPQIEARLRALQDHQPLSRRPGRQPAPSCRSTDCAAL